MYFSVFLFLLWQRWLVVAQTDSSFFSGHTARLHFPGSLIVRCDHRVICTKQESARSFTHSLLCLLARHRMEDSKVLGKVKLTSWKVCFKRVSLATDSYCSGTWTKNKPLRFQGEFCNSYSALNYTLFLNYRLLEQPPHFYVLTS